MAVFAALVAGDGAAQAGKDKPKPPYFASIGAGKARMRSGPGRSYPATWLYVRRDLPVPEPIAASYLRRGLSYRAWILIERLPDVRSLADLVAESPADAPWEQTGRLIARFHRAGLDHADLNAHNILFDSLGKGWLIDLDRGQLRIPETRWRARNLARLERSLLKLRGARAPEAVAEDFARLRRSYDTLWSRGT